MNRLLVLVLAFSHLLLSCENRRPGKVSAVELEAMLTVAGQEYVTTFGTQSEVGPYEVHGSHAGGGGPGYDSTTFDKLEYKFPHDNRQYIARKFRNPDGTAFMKISRFPEGSGEPKGEQDGTEQPATRSESKSEGSDISQPEAEGRSR